jgi:hypothetical protein
MSTVANVDNAMRLSVLTVSVHAPTRVHKLQRQHQHALVEGAELRSIPGFSMTADE